MESVCTEEQYSTYYGSGRVVTNKPIIINYVHLSNNHQTYNF